MTGTMTEGGGGAGMILIMPIISIHIQVLVENNYYTW